MAIHGNPVGSGGSHNHPYSTDGAMYPGDWNGGASHPGPLTEYAKFGDLGTSLPVGPVTTWRRGTQVEVAWTIEFNHGGGYQYRLCPSDQDLTEECFQKLPLDFVRGGAKLRFADKTTVPIQGTYVSQGTVPAGSTWAMNPVPARGRDPRHTVDIEFDPPCNESAHNGGGDGVCSGDTARWPKHLGLQVVDTLELPSALATGDYHLQWRWDCEGSAQVWTNCASIAVA